MKPLKRILSMVLVVCMIFTSQAFVTFAEGMENTEAIVKETTIEETTVKETAAEETTVKETEETTVETTVKETIIGENSEDSSNNELVSPDVDEKVESTETEYAEEPEEDEIETEVETEREVEETTAEAETEETVGASEEIVGESDTVGASSASAENKLFGEDPKNFYVVFYYNDENYSTWTLSESHINAVADDMEKEYFVDNLFDELIYNLSAAEPRGFYKIGDDTEYLDINYARQAYDRWSDATIELEKDKLLAEYESWVHDGAEHDVYYGTLINTYFYLLHYDSDGNPAFIQVKCTDTEDTVNAYLATIKGSAPSGKKFKTWQYWHADWYEEEGYDYSDDGEKEFYENLVEDSTKAYDDTALIAMFNSWINTDKPYENRHFGAIYEDDIFMYWIVDGAEDNRTIHYYANPGTGRTAVVIGTDGIEYTGLETSEKEKIKKAVIEEPIVATDVRRLFYYFTGLVSITNLGNLDTSNATSFKSMFEHCEAIEKIETSGLETDSLTDTSYMFTYCTSATDIILDDNFDTSNVTSMREMFNTTGAEELDLTNFDTSNVTDMYGMFSGCENLETIKVSDKFVVDKVTTSYGKFMFANCDKLVGEKGTKIADLSSPYGVAYAHIDEGSTNPGLFSGASTPTESKFCIKYFNITGTNWTSIASREEVHNIINNPVVKEFTASTDTSEVAAAIGTLGYTNGFKKLTKDEYDNYTGIGAATHTSDEEIYNIAKENGIFDQWKLSPTETVYYGVNYYYYDAELNYAENHSYGTWEIYDNTFDWNTDLSPHELVAFHNNDAEEAIVLPQVTVKGSDTYKMRNTSTGDIQYIWTWALQPDGMQERSFGDTENAWPFKPETNTLTLYAQWYGDTPTPPGPTPGKKVSSFVVKTNPKKTTYLSGDAFDPTGLVITVTYDDSTKADIDYDSHKSDFSFNPTTITASGDVVVTYGGKTATVAVTVAEVGDIYIIEAPDKTVYRVGQYFDPTGLVIQVVGDAEPIPYDKNKDLFTFEPSLTTALTTANKSVKVMFDGKSTTQAITVTNPTPTPPGGGGTGGSSSGDSNPEKGPMGDLTKNPMYQQQLQNQQLNTTNNIPQTSLLTDTALISTLQSYSQNQYMLKTNARDQYGNTGFGQWQHVPGTQTWYFLSGDLNSNGTTGTVGLLTNGWYNLGWDGQDKWYHFDANGVMGLGWYQEGGKTYYLETNPYDNWYGKAVTGQQIIDGQVYNFDASGALIS